MSTQFTDRHEKKRVKHSKDDRPSRDHHRDQSRSSRDHKHSSRRDEPSSRDHHHHHSSSRSSRRHRSRSGDKQEAAPQAKLTPVVQPPPPPAPKPQKPNVVSAYDDEIEDDDEPVEKGGGSQASLSVADTNALRAKLGLKPLDVGGVGGKDENGEEKKAEFVHAPAEDMWEKQKQKKMLEKLQESKDKRLANKKLLKVSISSLAFL